MSAPIGKPAWLHGLLTGKFFVPCQRHNAAKKNEKNVFCLDCCSCLCQHCVGAHCGHKLMQIRRYVYHDVIRLQEISKLVDCSGVQPYIINSARVVFLNQRPQPRPTKGSSMCKICERTLQEDYTYCSLGCKTEASIGVFKDPSLLFNRKPCPFGPQFRSVVPDSPSAELKHDSPSEDWGKSESEDEGEREDEEVELDPEKDSGIRSPLPKINSYAELANQDGYDTPAETGNSSDGEDSQNLAEVPLILELSSGVFEGIFHERSSLSLLSPPVFVAKKMRTSRSPEVVQFSPKSVLAMSPTRRRKSIPRRSPEV